MLNRIWKKFTLALLVVAFAPILYFGYQDLQAAKLSVVDETLRDIFINSVTRAKEIERAFINSQVDINILRTGLAIEFLVDTLSLAPEDSLYWKSHVEKEFIRFLKLKPGYSSIGFLDDYGDEIVVVSRRGGKVFAMDDYNKRNRLTSAYYVAAAKLDRSSVAAIPMQSAVHSGMDLKQVTMVRYSTTIYKKDGKPGGVIYLDMNGLEMFNGLSLPTFERRRPTAMVTRAGNYIFNPYSKPAATIPPKPLYENISDQFSKSAAEQILSGRPGIISDDLDTLFAYSPVYPQGNDKERYYVVFDYFPTELLAAKLSGIKQKYITGALVTLLLAIIIAVVVSRALTRQINRLREGVDKFAKHELTHKIDIRSKDEIQSLAESYNLMADSLKEYSDSLEKKVEQRSLRIKQVERKLMQAEKLAAIGFLSAGVAHEINNPISIIITRIELIERGIEKGDLDRVGDDLKTLKNHATRIGRIAGSLLTFSRDTTHEQAACDMNSVALNVMNLIKHPIEKKGVELVLDLAPDLPLVWASDTGLEQVIYNLVYNAFQATESGQRISVITRQCENNKVLLEICDTGCGISKSSLERIFDPFFTTKEVGKGTGLGLSISYGLVKEFGGTVNVESEPGHGAVFTIVLDEAKSRLQNEKADLVKLND